MKLNLEPTVKIREQIKSQQEVVQNEVAVAKKIETLAKIIAPKKTNYYVRHLDIISKRFPAGPTGFHTFVTSEDFAGHMVEWGSVNNRAYAPLRKAVKQLGLEFKTSAKGAALAESEKLGKYVREANPKANLKPDIPTAREQHGLPPVKRRGGKGTVSKPSSRSNKPGINPVTGRRRRTDPFSKAQARRERDRQAERVKERNRRRRRPNQNT